MMNPDKAIIILASILGFSFTVSVQATEFVYPSKGQSEAQQNKDKWECHQWATQQTGIAPEKMLQQSYDAKTTPIEEPTGLLRRLRMRKQLKERQAYIDQQLTYAQKQMKTYDSAYGTCLQGRGYSVSE